MSRKASKKHPTPGYRIAAQAPTKFISLRLARKIDTALRRRDRLSSVKAEGEVIECARELFGREVAMQLCRAMNAKRAAAKRKS